MELLEWQEFTLLHWPTVQVNMCSSPSSYNGCFRILEEWNESLYHFRYEDIRKKTGCIKPCKYLKYTVSFALHSHVDSPHYTFSVLVCSLSFRVAEPTRNFVDNICSRLVFKGWRKWDTGRRGEIDLLSCISGGPFRAKERGSNNIWHIFDRWLNLEEHWASFWDSPSWRCGMDFKTFATFGKQSKDYLYQTLNIK